MGLIVSRFRRKKTTTDILERLETNIRSIEKDGQCKEQAHKRVLGHMMAYSVGIYILFAVLYYYMYAGRSQHWLHSLLYASPLLVLPILVIFLRSGISCYFNWTLNKNRIKLNKMKEEKKKILEEVMNTETYKVAKEILDKYGGHDEQSKALKPFTPSLNVPGNASSSSATPGQIRQRQSPEASTTPLTNNTNMNLMPMKNSTLVFNGPRLRSNQLPLPLPDKNRSALDKLVDFIIKDGPNHRMAMICANCFSHNGMSMVEEFEFVCFNCAYCGKFNPARKQRPIAPLLSAPVTPMRALTPAPRQTIVMSAGDESSIASSASDSEDEKQKPKPGGAEGEKDRSSSPTEDTLKSDVEKKED